MSIDIYLYTEKKLSKEHPLLRSYGFCQGDWGYSLDTGKTLVDIECLPIGDADCEPDFLLKLKRALPNAKYQIMINISGNYDDDKIFSDLKSYGDALMLELDGVLYDENEFICPKASVVTNAPNIMHLNKAKVDVLKEGNSTFASSNANVINAQTVNVYLAPQPQQEQLKGAAKVAYFLFMIAIIAVPVAALVMLLSMDAYIDESGINPGYVAGLIVIGIAVILALIAVPFLVKHKKQQEQKRKQQLLYNSQNSNGQQNDAKFESIYNFGPDADGMTIVEDYYDYDQYSRELEQHVSNFFENIVYPKSFVDYLKKYENLPEDDFLRSKRAIKIPMGKGIMEGIHVEMEHLESFNTLDEKNFEYSELSEYNMMFRDIVIFAWEDGDHGEFLLDYGSNKTNPTVKYKSDDYIVVLADNFDEFLTKLEHCE